ncbi:hypothetical protein POM88_014201 [Heracleum sosnowskyi]|uniref:Uncharacterized protein n=1 Tax=Heracleum sosnowskyi TaxID=360622 RepID=A0AAD8MYS4_9APIA|nr:hypothetical protein POM88_014201 [Heracleum sosnowskyi]
MTICRRLKHPLAESVVPIQRLSVFCASYILHFNFQTNVARVTSLRDGINLVSYEFVVCQDSKKGVLILSEAKLQSNSTQSSNRLLILGFNAMLTEPVDTPGRRGGDQIRAMELKLHPDIKEPLLELCNHPNTTVVVLSGSDRSDRFFIGTSDLFHESNTWYLYCQHLKVQGGLFF